MHDSSTEIGAEMLAWRHIYPTEIETVVVSGALAYFGLTNSLERQIESVPEDDLLAK